MGNGMLGIWGMLYSGECPQIFQGISPNVPGNVTKHSEERHQTFREMSANILGTVLKHAGECLFYSRKYGRRVSPRFDFVVFVFVVNQKN